MTRNKKFLGYYGPFQLRNYVLTVCIELHGTCLSLKDTNYRFCCSNYYDLVETVKLLSKTQSPGGTYTLP